jgi:hypothetical protein
MKVDLFDMMASAEPPVIFSADRQFRYLLTFAAGRLRRC